MCKDRSNRQKARTRSCPNRYQKSSCFVAASLIAFSLCALAQNTTTVNGSLTFTGTTGTPLSRTSGTSGVAAEAGTLGVTPGAPLCNDGGGNVTDTINSTHPCLGATLYTQDYPSPTGTTLGQDIRNCLQALQAASPYGGTCDATADIYTTPDLDVNPQTFSVSSGTVGSMQVYLPCGAITTEVPIVLMPGVTSFSAPSFVAPGAPQAKFEGSIVWHGCGHSMGGTNSSSPTGTRIIPGSSFQPCASQSLISGCTHLGTWSVNTFPETTGDPNYSNFNQSMYVQPMGTGAQFTTSNIGEELIINPSSANQMSTSYGIITALVNGGVGACPSSSVQCALITYVQGYQSGQSNVGFILKAPLTALGAWPVTARQGVGMYGLRFVDLTLDCGSVPGSVPVAGCDPASNWNSAEKSGYSRDWLFNYIDIGLDVESPHTQASDYEELIFTPPASCDSGNDNLMAAVFINSGFRTLKNSSFVGANMCTPTYGILLDSNGADIHDIHVEHIKNMLDVGDNPGVLCPVWCSIIPTSNPQIVAGVSVNSLNGSCMGGTGTCTTTLLLPHFYQVQGSYFEVQGTPSGGNLPDTIQDTLNGQTLTTTNNPSVQWNLDGAGKVSWTDANPADFSMPSGKVGFDEYGAAANFGGGLPPSTPPALLVNSATSGADIADFQVSTANMVRIDSNGDIIANGTPVFGSSPNDPLLLLSPTASTAPTWSGSGTFVGINTQTGFAGNLLDFHFNGGGSIFSVNYQGNTSVSGQISDSFAGAASTPGVRITGTPFVGTSTNSWPQTYLDASSTEPTGFNTSGTMLGIAAPSGFAGDMFDVFQSGGSTTVFSLGNAGNISVSSNGFAVNSNGVCSRVGGNNTGVGVTGCNADLTASAGDQTGKSGDLTAQTILGVGTNAGTYVIDFTEVVTTQAGGSAVIPDVCVLWTDKDTNVPEQQLFSTHNSSGNPAVGTLGFSNGNHVQVNAKASTSIQIATGSHCTNGTGYAASPSLTMLYAIHARVSSN